MSPSAEVRACERCLRRAWLMAALAGHLQYVDGPPAVRALLALDDDELLAALARGDHGARVRAGHRGFEAAAARERCRAAGLHAVCRCEPSYPPALRDLEAAPAVLHTTSLEGLMVATAEPAAANALRSAWMPAPPPESEPAIESTHGMRSRVIGFEITRVNIVAPVTESL